MTGDEKDEWVSRIKAISHLSVAVVLAMVIAFMMRTLMITFENEDSKQAAMLELIYENQMEQTRLLQKYLDSERER